MEAIKSQESRNKGTPKKIAGAESFQLQASIFIKKNNKCTWVLVTNYGKALLLKT